MEAPGGRLLELSIFFFFLLRIAQQSIIILKHTRPCVLAFLNQFFDILSHFFRFHRGGVSSIWLSLVVEKKLFKVPCYVVIFHRRPGDLFDIVDQVIWNWTSLLLNMNSK